jgi:hypothetical protein
MTWTTTPTKEYFDKDKLDLDSDMQEYNGCLIPATLGEWFYDDFSDTKDVWEFNDASITGGVLRIGNTASGAAWNKAYAKFNKPVDLRFQTIEVKFRVYGNAIANIGYFDGTYANPIIRVYPHYGYIYVTSGGSNGSYTAADIVSAYDPDGYIDIWIKWERDSSNGAQIDTKYSLDGENWTTAVENWSDYSLGSFH